MQGIKGFNEIEASESFERMPAGAYVCRIVNAEDVAKSEYIRLDVDVAEGSYVDEAKNCYARANFWPLSVFCSYKENVRGIFKGSIQTIDKCNGTSFADEVESGLDESKLEDCLVGVVFYNEHYVGNNGDVKVRLKAKKLVALDKVRNGEVKTPDDEWTEDAKRASSPQDSMKQAEEDNPFK